MTDLFESLHCGSAGFPTSCTFQVEAQEWPCLCERDGRQRHMVMTPAPWAQWKSGNVFRIKSMDRRVDEAGGRHGTRFEQEAS